VEFAQVAEWEGGATASEEDVEPDMLWDRLGASTVVGGRERPAGGGASTWCSSQFLTHRQKVGLRWAGAPGQEPYGHHGAGKQGTFLVLKRR